MVRNVLGNDRTSQIFSSLAKPEYVRENPGYSEIDKRPYLTFWDDIMDRVTTYKLENPQSKNVRELLIEVESNEANLVELE
jgi:hypothetical protein